MVAPSRIAFGSCNEQDLQNNFWPIIEERNPASFIWGGDAIYADYDLPTDWTQFPPKAAHQCADPARLRHLYKQQKAVPGYKHLLKSNVTVFGTFDDHDYGCDNADSSYEFRYEAGIEFVKFLGQSPESLMSRRAQEGKGVYGVKVYDFARATGMQEVPDREANVDPDMLQYGSNVTDHSSVDPTTYSNHSVAVFVLDVRSNKSPWKQGSKAYATDYDGDFLGEEQWQWFETAIRRSRASVNVIVSGLQHHANLFPDPNVAEAWDKFPQAQQRLFDALLQEGVQAPLLISGDVHMTQLMRKDCERVDGSSPRRSLVELTTSGMTHSWGSPPNPKLASPREGPSIQERYESFFSKTIMEAIHYFNPSPDLLISSPPTEDGLYQSGGGGGAGEGLQYSLEKNVGELEFDWEMRAIVMRSISERPGAAPLLEASWTMDQLSGTGIIPGSPLTSQDFLDEAKGNPLRFEHGGGEWVCVSHRGSSNFVWEAIGHIAASAVAAFATAVPSPMIMVVCTLLVYLACWRDRHTKRSSNQPV